MLLDLQQWGELWEDFHDVLVSRSREQEDTVSWTVLEAELEPNNPHHG
ncbi:MAG: hypothetical protein VKK04_10300 [Synechococcales bacterium]|nr:hypothetical protein [Synechococcales bacterium]